MPALVYPHTDQRDEKGVTLTDTLGGPQEDYDEEGVSTLDRPNLEPRLSRRDQRRLGTGKVKRLLHVQALKSPARSGFLDDAIDRGAEHRPKTVLGINVRSDPEATRPEVARVGTIIPRPFRRGGGDKAPLRKPLAPRPGAHEVFFELFLFCGPAFFFHVPFRRLPFTPFLQPLEVCLLLVRFLKERLPLLLVHQDVEVECGVGDKQNESPEEDCRPPFKVLPLFFGKHRHGSSLLIPPNRRGHPNRPAWSFANEAEVNESQCQ